MPRRRWGYTVSTMHGEEERVLCTPLTTSGASEVQLARVGTGMGYGSHHNPLGEIWFGFGWNSFGIRII